MCHGRLIGTCLGALSFALSLVLAPETKGKVLQAWRSS
jgi:hypothetical protein